MQVFTVKQYSQLQLHCQISTVFIYTILFKPTETSSIFTSRVNGVRRSRLRRAATAVLVASERLDLD